ncbi:MAG: HDIG domain-containing protein [Bacteroidales bacterium]|nr:HDIG domain-containing protein [Bacteroidales bacterium]
MKRVLPFVRQHFHTIVVICCFVLTALLIVYFLPREGKFMFEYQKGGFWKHEDLTAPFNFPVYKSAAELDRERDSVLHNFRPVFNYDQEIADQRIQELSEDFSSGWVNFSIVRLKVPSHDMYLKDKRYELNRQLESEYRHYLVSLLRDIYRKGIIDLSPVEENGKVTYPEITVVRGNLADIVQTGDFYTPKTAYEQVMENWVNNLPEKHNLPFKKYEDFARTFEINKYLSINVTHDEVKSKNLRRSLVNSISLTRNVVQEGQGIISRGEFISDTKYQVLESLRKEYERNLGFFERQLVIFGKFLLVLTTMLVIYLFLYSFRKEVLGSFKRVLFILLSLVLMILIAGTAIKLNLITVYIVPFALLPIILKTFFDSRLALYVHIILVLLVGFFVPNGFEFVFLNVLAGMVAIISLTDVYRRSNIVLTALSVIVTYSVTYFGIALVQEGRLSQINYSYFGWFGVNGLLLLISYPLIYIFEKTFGFTSDATLLELSDTNQPLLRKLAELAPGTFQHSLQVANLAEDAVFHIGGNPLLVRAGALYHDIGKMDDPMYYIENQSNTINPHDNLSFEQSAAMIIGHVQKGVEMARKYKLPEAIVNFIRTHHGTTTVQYFYRSFLSKYPEAEVDVKRFSYPGPKPMSKETAIVMMADSVEAASRSLKNITAEAIEKLVDSIIAAQMTDGQYNDAQITFKDMTMVREVFKKRLQNIYHVRISYPQ